MVEPQGARQTQSDPSLLKPMGLSEFDHLRRLLLRPEEQRLDRVEGQVSALEARLGTPKRLEASTTQILVEALRKAELAQHHELAKALAPAVLASIRSEIINSKDMMVEALYPITGRLVSAGIAVAMADLVAKINQGFDRLLSSQNLMLRLRAWQSGRPFGELLLAQTQSAQLQRLLLLQHGSGLLLAQWHVDAHTDERADLIGGLLAALTDFARNALGDGGDLRTLDLGGSKIYLRQSTQLIVAAEFSGTLSRVQERQLDLGFERLLETTHGAEDELEPSVETYAASLAQAVEPTKRKTSWRRSPLSWAAFGLCAVILWSGWGYWRQRHAENQLQQAVHLVLQTDPRLAAYPVGAEISLAAGEAYVHGLAPDEAAKNLLISRLQAATAPIVLRSDLAIVETSAQIDSQLQQIIALQQGLQHNLDRLHDEQKRLADQAGQMQQSLTNQGQSIAQLGGHIDQASVDLHRLDQNLSAVDAGLTQLKQPVPPSPQERLAQAMRGFVLVYDVNNTQPQNVQALDKLKDLAPLMQAAGGVRIVTLSDGIGSAEINRKLALERAQDMARRLVDLGVSEDNIYIRLEEGVYTLNATHNQSAPNRRRLQFEPIYTKDISP